MCSSVEPECYDVFRAMLALPGADPSVANSIAVQRVACHGDLPMLVRLLADPRVNPAARKGRGLCALAFAAAGGHAACVRRLLADPRVDAACVSRALPVADSHLHFSSGLSEHDDAVSKLQTPTLEVLLADPRVDLAAESGLVGSGVLNEAIRHGPVELVDRVLRADARTGSFGTQPLFSAVKRGDAEIVARLLADPRVGVARPGAPGERTVEAPLEQIARWGHLHLLPLLLADPRVDLSAPRHREVALSAALEYHQCSAALYIARCATRAGAGLHPLAGHDLAAGHRPLHSAGAGGATDGLLAAAAPAAAAASVTSESAASRSAGSAAVAVTFRHLPWTESVDELLQERVFTPARLLRLAFGRGGPPSLISHILSTIRAQCVDDRGAVNMHALLEVLADAHVLQPAMRDATIRALRGSPSVLRTWLDVMGEVKAAGRSHQHIADFIFQCAPMAATVRTAAWLRRRAAVVAWWKR